jgi:transposase
MDNRNQIPFELPGFEIVQVDEYEKQLRVTANSIARIATCPDCQTQTTSVHTYYTRSPRDLPSCGKEIRLVLHVRRFRCLDQACSRKTFAERIPQIVPLHGQCTERLTRKLRKVVFETSAEGCARQTEHLQMPVSGDTLLRIQRNTPLKPELTPRILGIDDWAFRKGCSYGTILVDLERNQPVDLLPDRRTETVTAWLREHPEIEIVTRDRSNEYKAAISEALPHAIQVADRWHLMKNLGDALQSLLKRYARELKQVAHELAERAEPEMEEASPASGQKNRLLSRKELRFQEVQRLAAEGLSQHQIATRLQMSRSTVKKYLSFQSLPGYGPRQARPTILGPYLPYLESRWNEGCHNARILTEEIQAQGYQGGYATVRRYLKPRRKKKSPRNEPLPSPVKVPSPRQTARYLYLPSNELEPDQLLFRQALCNKVPAIALAYDLTQRFREMIQNQQMGMFDAWIRDALTSGIRSITIFAKGLLKDEEAVRAALLLSWSNGQVEGQINRLKTIKRMMYGRAHFDLLKIRVLCPP